MDDQKLTTPEEELVDFIQEHLHKWRDDMRSNYYEDWNRYERMWLGIYSGSDKERSSERSRVISPDTQQAIETYESEMVEAVFGGDKWFDIDDGGIDEDKTDIEKTKNQITEDFKTDKVQTAIKECITYAAVYGKGIGEIIMSETKAMTPTTKEMTPGLKVGGVDTVDRFAVRLKPVHPRNFLIDPTATTIEDAMGCAVEEMISAHKVIENQRKGVYRDIPIYSMEPTEETEKITQSTMPYRDGQVKLTKYYGLVPRKWLKKIKDSGVKEEDTLDKALGVGTASNPFEDYSDLVEAIIVIANDRTLLKAEENPFMMKDRPIVAYDCDPIPGKFWGRGVAQKGLMMQSAIDAQFRMHLDSMALTAAPMVAMDATRLPRGFQFQIHPGRGLKVNGNPAEAFMPFKFGETTPQIMETVSVLERKFLQATGTLDAAGMAADGGNGINSGISLALSGIIKKQRRSLMNFTEGFLIPFIQKAVWRYMQFDVARYPVKDYDFIPMSTLGLVAREYEQQHLMAVMSTLGPDSPLVPMLMIKYVENSGIQNKQEFIQQLQETMKPNPEEEKAKQEEMELQKRAIAADLMVKESEGRVNEAKAADLQETTRLREMELKANMYGSMSRNTETGDEFNQRVEVATLALKEMELDDKREDQRQNREIVRQQMQNKSKSE